MLVSLLHRRRRRRRPGEGWQRWDGMGGREGGEEMANYLRECPAR